MKHPTFYCPIASLGAQGPQGTTKKKGAAPWLSCGSLGPTGSCCWKRQPHTHASFLPLVTPCGATVFIFRIFVLFTLHSLALPLLSPSFQNSASGMAFCLSSGSQNYQSISGAQPSVHSLTRGWGLHSPNNANRKQF